jgi:hypothetical protein
MCQGIIHPFCEKNRSGQGQIMKEKKKKRSKGYTWNKNPSLLSIFPRQTCGDTLPLKKMKMCQIWQIVFDFF